MTDPSLSDRVALITGAGSGIGRSVAERFVAEGAAVVALDSSEQGLAELSSRLGDRVEAVLGDVRSVADNERAVGRATARFGALDVLVGNAGVFDGSLALDELSPEELLAAGREIFDVNVFGYMLAARASLEQLRRRGGAMVFTVSNAGFHAGSGGGILYATSKHAVVGLVRQLAHELAPRIRVNGVAPGGTITDLRVASALLGHTEARAFADQGKARSGIRATNPLRIVPEPEDHEAVYVLLASAAARAITGEIISSDGGLGVRGLDLEKED